MNGAIFHPGGGACPTTGTAGRATRFEPKDWWPNHVKPVPTTFVAARHRPTIWKP